jgi:hypothetical protein
VEGFLVPERRGVRVVVVEGFVVVRCTEPQVAVVTRTGSDAGGNKASIFSPPCAVVVVEGFAVVLESFVVVLGSFVVVRCTELQFADATRTGSVVGRNTASLVSPACAVVVDEGFVVVVFEGGSKVRVATGTGAAGPASSTADRTVVVFEGLVKVPGRRKLRRRCRLLVVRQPFARAERRSRSV